MAGEELDLDSQGRMVAIVCAVTEESLNLQARLIMGEGFWGHLRPCERGSRSHWEVTEKFPLLVF